MKSSPESDSERLIGPDLVLLLMRAPSGDKRGSDRIDGITRLEKLLFLADQETKVSDQVEEAFKYRPYDFGPYSKEIYEAVDLLKEAGLLNEQRVYEGNALDEEEELATAIMDREGVERRFSLTDRGKAVADYLGKKHPRVFEELTQIKSTYAAMPLRQLIRYVYGRYPAMAEHSKIRDKIS